MRLGNILWTLAVVTPIALVAGCSYQVHRFERSFETTKDGDSLQTVIERFGNPDVRETNAELFARYASIRCAAPCEARLWWEHPVLKGMEAWSVEFSSGHVIHKGHWVSP